VFSCYAQHPRISLSKASGLEVNKQLMRIPQCSERKNGLSKISKRKRKEI